MEITDTVYAASREEWRRWLADHHAERSEVWLVGYRKSAGKPCVAYNDAVEEALCFGWSDMVADLGEVRRESYEIAADIEAALRADGSAWAHWQSFSPSYRRIRAAYVDTARKGRPEEFRKRLENLVRKTAAGKQFGYGIEAYY